MADGSDAQDHGSELAQRDVRTWDRALGTCVRDRSFEGAGAGCEPRARMRSRLAIRFMVGISVDDLAMIYRRLH
jgi:hypothetical protein